MVSFDGSITVTSSPGKPFSVSMQCKTDSHDLGHALAAIIAIHLDQARKGGYAPERVLEALMEGIQCGMRRNPAPRRAN